MPTHNIKTSCPPHDATAAFMAKKLEIDTLLKRLQAVSDDHFNLTPDAIRWCDVDTLASYAHTLQQLSNIAFGEGEYQK